MPEHPKSVAAYCSVILPCPGQANRAVCNLTASTAFSFPRTRCIPGAQFRMADDVLEAYVKQVIESQREPQVTIAWQGGEPTLMGLDFYRRAMTLVRKYMRPGMTLEHTIQTNGILMNEEWCEFLRTNNFLVGLSVDGPREMHDAYRVDKGGAPTFEKVMRAARLMQQHKVEFNVLCTVHAANVEHPLEVYRFFRDELKTQFVQFIPIVERARPELLEIANQGWGESNHTRPLYTQEGSLVTERTVKSEQWGQFLIAIFDEWVRHDVGNVFIQLFESALASWMGMPLLCASSPRLAATPWRSSIMATFILATILSSQSFFWGTSRNSTWCNSSRLTSSGNSEMTNRTPCLATAGSAK